VKPLVPRPKRERKRRKSRNADPQQLELPLDDKKAVLGHFGLSLSNCLARPQVDQMHLATGETSHWLVTAEINVGNFLNDKAMHFRSSDWAAIEKWRHFVSAPRGDLFLSGTEHVTSDIQRNTRRWQKFTPCNSVGTRRTVVRPIRETPWRSSNSNNEPDAGQDKQHVDDGVELTVRHTLEDVQTKPRAEEGRWHKREGRPVRLRRIGRRRLHHMDGDE
jgi:hypothetical protein